MKGLDTFNNFLNILRLSQLSTNSKIKFVSNRVLKRLTISLLPHRMLTKAMFERRWPSSFIECQLSFVDLYPHFLSNSIRFLQKKSPLPINYDLAVHAALGKCILIRTICETTTKYHPFSGRISEINPWERIIIMKKKKTIKV